MMDSDDPSPTRHGYPFEPSDGLYEEDGDRAILYAGTLFCISSVWLDAHSTWFTTDNEAAAEDRPPSLPAHVRFYRLAIGQHVLDPSSTEPLRILLESVCGLPAALIRPTPGVARMIETLCLAHRYRFTALLVNIAREIFYAKREAVEDADLGYPVHMLVNMMWDIKVLPLLPRWLYRCAMERRDVLFNDKDEPGCHLANEVLGKVITGRVRLVAWTARGWRRIRKCLGCAPGQGLLPEVEAWEQSLYQRQMDGEPVDFLRLTDEPLAYIGMWGCDECCQRYIDRRLAEEQQGLRSALPKIFALGQVECDMSKFVREKLWEIG